MHGQKPGAVSGFSNVPVEETRLSTDEPGEFGYQVSHQAGPHAEFTTEMKHLPARNRSNLVWAEAPGQQRLFCEFCTLERRKRRDDVPLRVKHSQPGFRSPEER